MALITTPERAEQKLIGSTLKALREKRRLVQADVAAMLNMTTQAWQKYEAGERKFTVDRIATVLQFLSASDLDYEAERARILGDDPPPHPGTQESAPEFIVEVYGRARAGPQGAEVYDVAEPLRRIDLRQILGKHSDAMQIVGDSMVPWAEPGEVVLFDRDSYPRRGSGCVIETLDGAAYVKLYEKSDGSTLFVRELYPEERTISFDLRNVKGVYAVKLRGD
jgi:phage repressor protein C with HTH and peptisase S24 domain